jgi:hypothetical protein
VTFDVKTVKKRISLCTLEQTPSRPVLYRIANVLQKPNYVGLDGGAIGVNAGWGSKLPERVSERRVGERANGWFYDAAAKRLIVKVSKVGTNCPPP